MDADLATAIADRIESYDRTWSRFRPDSLVAAIGERAGHWPFPDEAPALFDLYRRLYAATDGAMSPLVGKALDTLGYDRAYSLTPAGDPAPAPAWDEAVAWDGAALSTLRPVRLDVGAAGKGYLVDLIGGMLRAAGHDRVVIDASGDIRHWGDGVHHVIDALTGLPTRSIVATWAIAPTALEADGLATALFFADPARLEREFAFQWVRMDTAGRVEFSPHLNGELFT